eukprot:TRINITY_DN68999_c0_g1_i1.p1 TRINITY_DN68999_c0_g1~~TRINITY_DN68999_c0_g1_i1.p1  ORF type:complete len:412 (+),score=80.46 TRINITY_DN68999_c0_g1_i1:75-1310(+)
MRFLVLPVLLLVFSVRSQRVCRLDDYLRSPLSESRQNVTSALRAALAECVAGTVIVSSGRHVSGPFNLSSYQTLHLEEGAELLASPKLSDWPAIAPLPSYGVSRDTCPNPSEPPARFHPFILAYNVTNAAITGAGTIDGNGAVWWPMCHSTTLTAGRPRLIEWMYGRNGTIDGVTLRNSPFWTVHLYAVTTATVRRVTIDNPTDVGNTDGVDPDSSTDVTVTECNITCGDDGIAIKSGWDVSGARFGRPTERVVVENSWFNTANGVSIGSEMSGGVRGVIVRNVSIAAHSRALYIKTGDTRGAYVKDVAFQDITIRDADTVIAIQRDYGAANPQNPPGWAPAPSQVGGISYTNIKGTARKAAGVLVGADDAPLTVSMQNVDLTAPEGFSCTGNVRGRAVHVVPHPCFGPAA